MAHQRNRARQRQAAQAKAQAEAVTGTHVPATKATIVAVAVVALLVAFAAGLFTGRATAPGGDEGAAGPTVDTVAATVADLTIMESSVTDYIDKNMRVDSSTGALMDAESWQSYLDSNGWTPETLREAVIRNVFAWPQIVVSTAAAQGIEPDEATVQSDLEAQKAETDDWDQWLADNGFADEAAFVLSLRSDAVYSALLEANTQVADPTDAEIDAYVLENAAAAAGPRLSLVYLPYTAADTTAATTGDDATTAKAKADSALIRIQAGEDFGTVADEVNAAGTTDTAGDIGWGQATYLPESATTALAAMAVGDVSAVLEDADAPAYLILKITDHYTLAEDGTVDVATVPAALRTKLAADLADANASDA
ncbi:MAG: peptidylprolyl isomerase, partial [Propionibacteriaceae bacterium]|nr:peptidylprolyl isomerase [Propionibacteriaceae bacterium]